MGLTCYWVSSQKMTFLVEVDCENIVRSTAPIARRFVGQSFKNLLGWISKQGGLRTEVLPERSEK